MTTFHPGRATRRIGLCLALALTLVRIFAAPMKFDIPAQAAPGALKTFIQQSGTEVMFPFDELKDVRTNAVSGSLEPDAALQAILRDTGFAAKGREQGKFVVMSASKSAGAANKDASPIRPKEPAPNDPNVQRAALPASDRPRQNGANDRLTGDETITLSPFQVTADEDTGYQATSTLAGTRLRSDLKDLAASISVVTKDFMNDVNATDITSLLVYTLGTEVGGFGGNFSDLTNPESGGVFDDQLGQASPGTRVRGLIGADRTRGYFLTDIPLDSYNIERVEVSRGANAMLFGLGSPAGIVNSGIIAAGLNRMKTTVGASFGSYGSYRATLDHNYVLKRDVLALRLATVFDNTRYRTEFAFAKKKGITLAAAYQPFRNTTMRINSEIGRSDSNRPEQRPPYDRFSWWWAAGKPVWDPVPGTGRLLGTPEAPFTATSVFQANGTRAAANLFTANYGQWASNVAAIFYQDPNSSQFGGVPIGGGATVDGVKGFADNAYLNAAGTALTSGGMLGLNSWSIVNQNIYQASNPLRALYNKDPMVSDPRIFDFYHQMLGGPTKYEFARWEAHNATIEQAFFNRKAGIELAVDRQRIDNGFTSPFEYRINLDPNERLPNGAPNPNFLRPVSPSVGFKRIYSQDRDALRATAYYALDLRRARGPAWLGRILGRHLLNGNYSRQDSLYQQIGGFPWQAGTDWPAFNGQALPGQIGTGARNVAVLRYLGPSVQNTTGPEDLRAQGLTAGQDPAAASFTLLANRRPATNAAAGLQPWTPATFSLLTNGRENVDNSNRSGQRYSDRTEQQVHSTAFALQSHLLEGAIVATAGWRRDLVWSYDAGIAPSTSTGNADLSWDAFPTMLTRSLSQETTNWGVVGHLPGFVRRRLPAGIEASAFYNSATNFRVAPQRYTITGEALDSETGETEEYGLRFSVFDGKLDFRVARFRSVADKASVGNLLGAIGQLSIFVENTVDQNYLGNNVGNPAGIAAFEGWLESPGGVAYRRAFNTSFAPNNDASRPADTYGRYSDATSNRGQVTGASALESTGHEFEVIFNPTRNWRISANAASTQAVRTNIAPELFDFLFNPQVGLVTLVQNPNGTPTDAGRIIGGPLGGVIPLQNFISSNVVNNGLITTFAQEGSKTDELRKWSFRGVTNYSFTSEQFEGRLKGVNLGGAVRWSAGPVLGYEGKTIVSGGQTLVVSDVTKPYIGEAEAIFDAWIGYSRKLRNRYNWKVQLNVRNVGVGNELRPLAVLPDGRPVQWIIKEAQRWTLTNTFTF